MKNKKPFDVFLSIITYGAAIIALSVLALRRENKK